MAYTYYEPAPQDHSTDYSDYLRVLWHIARHTGYSAAARVAEAHEEDPYWHPEVRMEQLIFEVVDELMYDDPDMDHETAYRRALADVGEALAALR